MKIEKKIVSLLCIVIVSFPLLLHATDYHVAKTGNDNNLGTLEEPFLTISKAAEIAQAGDVVHIHEGTYRETVTPANSGAEGSPIIYQSVPGEKVIISAMEEVNGFTLDDGSVYKTTLDWNLGQRMFVIHDNTLLDLARWPNNTDGDRFSLNAANNTGGSGPESPIDGYLTSPEIPDLPWENGGTLYFLGASRWYGWKFPITATSSGRVDWRSTHNPEGSQWVVKAHTPGAYSKVPGEFFLEGIREALDYQNEWYFDNNTMELFLQLPSGQAPADGSIQVSRRENAINIQGKNHIEFRNLAVIGGSIIMNGDNNKLYQVSSFYGAMTRGSDSKGLFTQLAAVVVSWKPGGGYYKNNVIEKCEIAYNDASGIRVVGENSSIINNYIHDASYLGTYDSPLTVRDGITTTVKGNTLTKSGRDVVKIINKGSEFSYNDVSVSNLIATDCALLYAIGYDLNIDIHHNWFHDARGRGELFKAAGIYLDNSAGNVRVYRNVVWNIDWTTLQTNWEVLDVDVYNNTLVKAEHGTMGSWYFGKQFKRVNIWNNLTDRPARLENFGSDSETTTWTTQADKQNNLINSETFQDFGNNNFKLKSDGGAVDFGREIEGFTDGFAGEKPDVGAYELGDDWVPGIDWNKINGPNNICYGLPGELCNGKVGVTAITINSKELNFVSLGEKQGIDVTVTPSDATFKGVIWSSDNPVVAVVSKNGVVTAVGQGTAKITGTTEDGGFTDETTVRVGFITGLNRVSSEHSISVYPNPLNSETLTLDCGNPSKQCNITIYNNTGQLIHEAANVDHKIELDAGLFKSKGLYLMNLEFEDGTTVYHKLMVD